MLVDPWTPPESFAADLYRLTDDAQDAGMKILAPALAQGYDEGFRATPRMAAAVAALMTNAEIRRIWQRAGRRSAEQALAHWLKEARRAGIIDDVSDPELPARILATWDREQQDRYRNLRDQVRRETESRMRADRDKGVQAATAAGTMLALGLPTFNGRMRGRGRVIAADQLETLAGLIARTQQLDAGISMFLWQTREDDRVRDTHAPLNQKRFPWEKPPPVGHPGIPIGCRCVARGVVE